jgi:molybdenum cofactor synthesis domain-containing protein
MLSVEEAQDRLLEAVGSPLPVEDVPLAQALDRALAEPIRSAVDLPPWDNSSMDGFAVHAADVAGATATAPIRLRVVGDVRAGGSPHVDVPPGCAVRIATGAPMPPSADAVVPVETTIVAEEGADSAIGEAARVEPALVEPAPAGSTRALGFRALEPLPDACLVTAAVEPGAFIRRRGEDVRAGMLLLEPHRRVGPAQIALAAAVGVDSLRVHRRPVAGVLSTGDELRLAGQELGESGIPDANRPGLLAMCSDAGARAADLGIAGDSLESILRALRPAIEGSDLLIVSGGVSLGPYDIVRTAFEALGQVELWRVAIQPGKPFAFGRSSPRDGDGRRVLLFGLPGNPVSALVTFELFVRPALQRLSGLPAPTARVDRAVTEGRLEKAAGRRGYLRVTVVRDGYGSPIRDPQGRLRVRVAGHQGSHVLSAMAVADALAIVPEAVERLEPGAEVEIRWLRA